MNPNSQLGITGIVLGMLLIHREQPNQAAATAFAPTRLFAILLGGISVFT